MINIFNLAKLLFSKTMNATINEEMSKLLLQAEGFAVMQNQKYKTDLNILNCVKKALAKNQMLEGVYHDKDREIEPLGLIYGNKIYLIGYEKQKGDDIYTFALHKFKNLKVSNKKFKKKDFNLKKYAEESFGIYRGETLDIELEFDKNSAQDAVECIFHPTQKFTEMDDGRLLVNFSAKGGKEVIQYVFKWGKACKINAPESLKEEYINYLKENLKNYQ